MIDQTLSAHPFRLNGALNLVPVPALNALVEGVAERWSGLRNLASSYDRIAGQRDPAAFLAALLADLDVRYQVSDLESRRIPATGPVVVVANHPFGCIEGIVMAQLLTRIRPDVRIVANYHLKRIPQLRDLFIGVDPFNGAGAVQRNVKPMREALNWIKNGGLLLVFPAGEVSHLKLRKGRVVDSAWSATVGRLIRLAKAPVAPVYIHGANSWGFQLAGLVHPNLRTLLIPRELMNKRGHTLRLNIGQLIAPRHWQSLGSDAEIAAHLRLRTYMLKNDVTTAAAPFPFIPVKAPRAQAAPSRLVERCAAGVLAAEISALPPEQRLAESGALQVYYAKAEQILWLLREIGRLREVTFREVGEGTGNPIDLDLFDSYYLHLFIWDTQQQCVVGAYRLGLTDQILARYGKKGLYTHSLFKFKGSVLNALNPAVELGRSFIRAEYQRSFAPLLLLWKGIATFVAQRPRYRTLFGPVSISNDYQHVSRQLLVDYLKTNSFEKTLARFVKPRRPFRSRWRRIWDGRDLVGMGDIDVLSDVIANLEHDQKGVPILLKQYLKLGGRLLGFNVDDQFSDALDGLIMVDLCDTDPKVLARYMGQDAAQRFLAYHSAAQPALRAVS